VEQSTPSQHVEREERAVLLADGLAALPETQRDALILQYWHGWSLAAIGQHLGRSPAAVAGLLKRDMRNLRDRLGSAGGPLTDAPPEPRDVKRRVRGRHGLHMTRSGCRNDSGPRNRLLRHAGTGITACSSSLKRLASSQ
jgi:hypothetical protein